MMPNRLVNGKVIVSMDNIVVPESPHIVIPGAVAAGGIPSLPPAATLRPFEVINQNRTWAPDETYANDRNEECFQACTVMVMRYCAGVWLSAAYLHDVIHAATEDLPTTIAQGKYTLANICETASIDEYPQTQEALKSIVCNAISHGHPCILLRYFQYPGNSILHFVVAYGYTSGLIQLAGPWSGTSFTEDWDQTWQMFAGATLHVLRKRMLGNH